MGKNSQIHFFIETAIFEKLKQQAQELNISFAEFCRRKLKEIPQLNRIEYILNEIERKIKYSTKFNQEV